ncbi:MAG: hypothetical protein U0796_08305 [Gemmatales bacterium]
MNHSIKLPRELHSWVSQQAKQQGLPDATSYMRRLIVEEKRRQAVQKLSAIFAEADQSGPAIEVNEDSWKAHGKKLFAKLKARAKKLTHAKN